MNNKTDNIRIVIISAVFFPRNSPRANRATELAKEFARRGYKVTVYAILGNYDYSEFERKYQIKVEDFGKIVFVNLSSDENKKNSNLNRLLSKMFKKSLDFPFIELFFKVINILKREKNIDLLITIAMPYTIHWGAAYAKTYFHKNNIRNWVADCGDPYMGNKLEKHPFYFKYVEKWFCRKADYLTVPIEQAKKAYYSEFHSKIKVIPQGFNFDEVKTYEKVKCDSIPTFVYAGAFYKGIRDPRAFLTYLSSLNFDFKFYVFTKNKNILEGFKEKLGDKLEICDYIPRVKLITFMSQVDFLVNFENGNEVQSPSKLIDYVLSKRPIISIPSVAINKNQIDDFLIGDYTNQLIIENIEQYNIKNVVNDFISLMKIN